MGLTLKQVCEKVRDKFPKASPNIVEVAGDPYVVVAADAIVDVCRWLRDDAEMRFDLCASIAGQDDTKDFWVVYHLYSVPKNHRAVIKVKAEPRATIPTSMRVRGRCSVTESRAKAGGKQVKRMTTTRMSHTWFASHTGPIESAMSARCAALRGPLASRSQTPPPKSAPPKRT